MDKAASHQRDEQPDHCSKSNPLYGLWRHMLKANRVLNLKDCHTGSCLNACLMGSELSDAVPDANLPLLWRVFFVFSTPLLRLGPASVKDSQRPGCKLQK